MTLIEKIKAPAIVHTVTIDGIGPVRIRQLKTREVLDLSKRGDQDGGLAVVALAVQDEDGQPVFADAAAVGDADWLTVKKLIDAALRINDLGRKIEAAEGN